VIDQALKLEDLARGMARCLRERILPHIADASARIQAEEVARVLDALPGAFGSARCARLRDRIARARAVLERVAPGSSPVEPSQEGGTRDDLAREHARFLAALAEVADRLRGRDDAQSAAALGEVRQFFARDLQEEVAEAGIGEIGLRELSARERREEDEGKRWT